MESFFLSETAKYLFLLGAGAGDLPDFFVLTTEGHLLPPLPSAAAHSAGFPPGDAAAGVRPPRPPPPAPAAAPHCARGCVPLLTPSLLCPARVCNRLSHSRRAGCQQG